MRVLLHGIVIVGLAGIFADSYCQSTAGPNNPSAEADGAGGGGGVPAWNFGSGTAFSANNTYAQDVALPKNKLSNYLLVTGFGFSVPTLANITGITVEVQMYATGPVTGSVTATNVMLINSSGSIVGTNHATSSTMPYGSDPNTYITYGSSIDSWGGVMDYNDINSANFGVALQYTSSNTGLVDFNLFVDEVRVTITYIGGMTAVANGCFNDGATWGHTSPGVAGTDYPDATTAAAIPGGRTVNVCAGTTANCYSLVINSNASPTSATVLNLANSTATLNVATTILMLTSLSPTADFTSSINLAGGTITTQRNFIMTAARNGGSISKQLVTFTGGTLTVNGDITMTGSVAAATTILDMTAANSVLNMGGDLSLGTGASLTNSTGVTGTINYKGSSSQIIRSAITYFNLTFSGGGTKTLEGATAVKGTLNMTSGNCDMAAQSITLGTGAALASNGTLIHTSGTLYNGTFTRWFSTSTIADGAVTGKFPVGISTDLRPFSVYFPTTGPSAGGTLSMVHNDPGTSPIAVSFADGASTVVRRTNMNWVLTAANGFNVAAGNLNARIEGTNIGTIGVVTPVTTDLRITRSGDVIGTAGTNAGTTTNPIIRRTALPAFTATSNTFYVGSVDATNTPLPIGLTKFKALAVSDGVQVEWTTATEVDNDFFTVERSAEGEIFTGIGVVKGNGTTSMNYSYILKDGTPLTGLSYYRLKQTDYDGKSTYSKIVSVQYEGQILASMRVYPNPSRGNGTTLEIRGLKDMDSIPVLVYDMMGKVCANLVLGVDKNSGSITTKITFETELPAGIYILRAGYSQTLSSKLVIVN